MRDKERERVHGSAAAASWPQRFTGKVGGSREWATIENRERMRVRTENERENLKTVGEGGVEWIAVNAKVRERRQG